jgi:hypothetical protein
MESTNNPTIEANSYVAYKLKEQRICGGRITLRHITDLAT